MTSASSSTAVTTTRADLLAYVAAAVVLGCAAAGVQGLPGSGPERVAASLPGPGTGVIVWAIARASGARPRLPKVMFWTSLVVLAMAILVSFIQWQVRSGR